MNMESLPERIVEKAKKRTLSDATFLRGGAAYVLEAGNNLRLEPTEEQMRKIMKINNEHTKNTADKMPEAVIRNRCNALTRSLELGGISNEKDEAIDGDEAFFISKKLPELIISKLTKDEILYIYEKLKAVDGDPDKQLEDGSDMICGLHKGMYTSRVWNDIKRVVELASSHEHSKSRERITQDKLDRVSEYVIEFFSRNFCQFDSFFRSAPKKTFMTVLIYKALIKFEADRRQPESEVALESIEKILSLHEIIRGILTVEETASLRLLDNIITLNDLRRKTIARSEGSGLFTPNQRKCIKSICDSYLTKLANTSDDNWDKIKSLKVNK